MSNNDKHNKHKSNQNNNQENQYQSSPMDQGDKIVDMKKFDQSDILKLIQHATEIGKTSNEKLSKPFLDSILSMKLSGSDMHKDIGNHINNEHESVLKSFNNVFKSGSDYVNDTQNMQSTERPSDFKKDPVKDLRETNSLGFPLEEKDFHNKIPKIEIAENPTDEVIIKFVALTLEQLTKSIAAKTELMKNIGDYLQKIYGSDQTLAFMVRYSESGKNGPPGIISPGKGDEGGPSYGSYQLSSHMGTLLTYVKQSKYKDELNKFGLDTAKYDHKNKIFHTNKFDINGFNAKWKEIVAKHPNEFKSDQHNFIKTTHYDPLLKNLKAHNMDLSNRSEAVQEIIFSTSTQYGKSFEVVTRALEGKNINDLSDKEIISIIQDDKLKHVEQDFKSSESQWKGIKNRIKREKADTLAMLEFKELKEEVKQLEKQKEQLESKGKLA